MRAYLSHAIRGKKGKDATDVEMIANNQLAIDFAKTIKCVFPRLDLYVPGEHDEFVLHAYRLGYMSEQRILEIDCMIVSDCDFLIAWAPEGFISKGMQVEIDYAQANGIPVVIVNGPIHEATVTIGRQLQEMMR